MESVLNTIKSNMPEKYFPDMIILYNELPRTQVGKVGYIKLKEIGERIAKENSNCSKLHIIKYSK